eukprot:1773453-Alexandrium_andersonii.AAC.1
MPIPPWDPSYQAWAMGPALDTFQGRPERHACLVISMPVLHRLLGGDASRVRVDTTGSIQCYGTCHTNVWLGGG